MAMAASAVATNWLGGVTTNNATVQFMMASNLTLQVTFADVTKPTLSITNVTAGMAVSNASFTVRGGDNVAVAGVFVRGFKLGGRRPVDSGLDRKQLDELE